MRLPYSTGILFRGESHLSHGDFDATVYRDHCASASQASSSALYTVAASLAWPISTSKRTHPPGGPGSDSIAALQSGNSTCV